MAHQLNPTYITHPASSDLSSNQFYLGALATDGEVGLQTTRGGVVVGVIYDKSTAQGISARVQHFGRAKVWAGGSSEAALAVGAALVASTGGVAIAYSTTGSYVIGRAAENLSSGSTSIIAVDLTHEGIDRTS